MNNNALSERDFCTEFIRDTIAALAVHRELRAEIAPMQGRLKAPLAVAREAKR